MIGETTFEEIEDRRLSAALNDAAFRRPMPQSLVDKVMAIGNSRLPVHRQIPRWALLAASLVLMAGFVFAATMVVDAISTKEDNSEETVGRVAPNAPDSFTMNDALAASETGGTRAVASSEVPSDENPPTTADQQPSSNNQLENEKGEEGMNIKQKAALTVAAVTVAGLAPPVAAGVASATSSAMASFSSFVANSAQTPTTLEGGFHSFVSQAVETDTLPQFNSREPRGSIFILR